mgnify:CR=1 FL=1
MAKPELGAKRQCQACAAKFFDLNRDPIICPKCGTVFQGATMRAERTTAKDEENEDEPASAAGVEIVSLDEVEAAEEKSADPVVDDIDVEPPKHRRRSNVVATDRLCDRRQDAAPLWQFLRETGGRDQRLSVGGPAAAPFLPAPARTVARSTP